MMDQSQIEAIVNRKFRIPENEGPSKVMSLQEAVRRNVVPGSSLYFGFFHARAYAVAYEIARQFWGARPDFELIVAGILEYGVILLHGGLVKKAIAAFGGNTYPFPAPNRIIQKAFKDGRLEMENWTNLTIPLRLMAGALDLPFIPTNSLVGTSLAQENESCFRLMDNPFGAAQKSGVMKPLKPDLAIVHGLAADAYGNTIVLGPYGEDVWGVMASRQGVLVSVEQLVSTDFIREHSHLVKIPGYLVKSVSVVPFGAHPQPMTNLGLPQFQGYGEDYQFRLEFKEATKNEKQMSDWVEAWVLNQDSHEDYLRKLGYERLLFLKGKSWPEAWRHDLNQKLDRVSLSREYTSNEAMIIGAARGIKDTIKAKGYKTVLAGAGMATLAAWLAVIDLKSEGVEVELMAESGFYGYLPRPGDPYVFNYGNIPTNKMQGGFIEILGLLGCGSPNSCLAVLGAGQIDHRGNINSTRIADDSFLVGSGGANDIGTRAREVIVLSQQGWDKYVNRLPYVTTPGRKVSKLYSGLGIYEKLDGQEEFSLVGLVAGPARAAEEDQVSQIKKSCQWNLGIAAPLTSSPPPTDEELLTLRLLDPEGLLLGTNDKANKSNRENP
ncbi:MAG: CoA-transferase [Thermodesulfobacteriota bacterium]